MCVCMHVYMHVHVFMCAHVCPCVLMCVHVCSLCSCVCVFVCVHVGYTCHGTHVEVRGQLSSWSSPSNLFETGLVGQVSWHTYFWGLSLPYLRTALYRQALWSSVFTWILGIPGPHTCTGSTSPSEPSPPFSIIDLLPPVENLFLGLSSGDGSIFFPVSVTS